MMVNLVVHLEIITIFSAGIYQPITKASQYQHGELQPDADNMSIAESMETGDTDPSALEKAAHIRQYTVEASGNYKNPDIPTVVSTHERTNPSAKTARTPPIEQDAGVVLSENDDEVQCPRCKQRLHLEDIPGHIAAAHIYKGLQEVLDDESYGSSRTCVLCQTVVADLQTHRDMVHNHPGLDAVLDEQASERITQLCHNLCADIDNHIARVRNYAQLRAILTELRDLCTPHQTRDTDVVHAIGNHQITGRQPRVPIATFPVEHVAASDTRQHHGDANNASAKPDESLLGKTTYSQQPTEASGNPGSPYEHYYPLDDLDIPFDSIFEKSDTVEDTYGPEIGQGDGDVASSSTTAFTPSAEFDESKLDNTVQIEQSADTSDEEYRDDKSWLRHLQAFGDPLLPNYMPDREDEERSMSYDDHVQSLSHADFSPKSDS